jgi:hypothetical protein
VYTVHLTNMNKSLYLSTCIVQRSQQYVIYIMFSVSQWSTADLIYRLGSGWDLVIVLYIGLMLGQVHMSKFKKNPLSSYVFALV